jgi:hypothetical protein
MAEKRTLWQVFVGWIKGLFAKPEPPPKPAEEQIFNPLEAKVEGSTIIVDMLDLKQYTFVVNRILESKLDYGDRKFSFTDYYCRAALHDGDPVEIKVRVYPHDQPGHKHQLLVLKKWDEFEYSEDFKAVVDENKEFNLSQDDKVIATFWRINDVKTAYKAKSTDLTNTGSITEVAVKTRTAETWYWDYWRETKDEGNSDYKEFLFVEWDKGDTGMFTIWRGEEVSPRCITAI